MVTDRLITQKHRMTHTQTYMHEQMHAHTHKIFYKPSHSTYSFKDTITSSEK